MSSATSSFIPSSLRLSNGKPFKICHSSGSCLKFANKFWYTSEGSKRGGEGGEGGEATTGGDGGEGGEGGDGGEATTGGDGGEGGEGGDGGDGGEATTGSEEAAVGNCINGIFNTICGMALCASCGVGLCLFSIAFGRLRL